MKGRDVPTPSLAGVLQLVLALHLDGAVSTHPTGQELRLAQDCSHFRSQPQVQGSPGHPHSD